ncbi:MAG TPA: Rieske (2Fe-2S) protein [Chloroflexota bacterium]|jgi:Rieske Fe-S protein|nr:Rieske (2Fe-2S) protein [Chloroflexota bacterium]
MSDELERLNRVLDDLAAERDPHDRHALSAEDASLAQTAAFLKAAAPDRGMPNERFVERLSARVIAMREQSATATTSVTGNTAPEGATAQAGEAAVGTTPRAPARGLSRRGLIGRIAAMAAGAAAGAGAGEALRGHADTTAAAAAYERGKQEGMHQATSSPYREPMAPPDRGRWFATGQNRKTLSAAWPVHFQVGAVAGFLVNPGNGKPIYAVSAVCTHMGCLLSWMDSAGTFLCPCHGAQYQADGTVLSGIARHPLPRLEVRVDDDGEIYVWAVDLHPTTTKLLPYQNP